MAAVVRRPVATPPCLGPPRPRPRHASVITIETAPASFGLATRATSLPDHPNPNPSFNTIDNNDTQFAVVYQRSVRGDTSNHTSSYNTDAELRCLICFEPKPFASRTTPRCTHESRVCDDCLARHVQISVCDRGFTNVTCPVLSCREVLQYEDLRAVVKDQEVFARYERLLLRRTLDKVPNFVWCKNPACSSGQIHDQDSLCPMVRCRACKAETCFDHDVPWHTGLTCVEYEVKMKRSAQASKYRASENYISKHAKACPNCRRMIEKAHGCDHMTCMEPMGCGHEFCWCCLADYKRIHEQGNHYHKRRCRHYDSRLKLALKRALVWILRL